MRARVSRLLYIEIDQFGSLKIVNWIALPMRESTANALHARILPPEFNPIILPRSGARYKYLKTLPAREKERERKGRMERGGPFTEK